jgi:hypothetical protein
VGKASNPQVNGRDARDRQQRTYMHGWRQAKVQFVHVTGLQPERDQVNTQRPKARQLAARVHGERDNDLPARQLGHATELRPAGVNTCAR